MNKILGVWYEKLPPTGNHIFIMGSKLKDPARQYKAEFRQWMAQTHGHLLQQLPPDDHNTVYGLALTFYMSCVNDSWNNPKVSPSQRAKERFKKSDLTNRIKFMEDCIRDVTSIDDSKTFISWPRKMHSVDREGVYFEVYAIPVEEVGIERVNVPES